ncbi:MAG: VanZ family protein [Chitinophagaceae bacterium]
MLHLLSQLNKFLNKNKWAILLYWIVVIILLILPGNKFPKQNWFKILHVDKWVHVGLFSGLTFCSLSLPKWVSKNRAIIISILCFTFGIAIEFIQEAYILNRSFDLWDIVADGVGVIIGFFLIIQFIKNKQNERQFQ